MLSRKEFIQNSLETNLFFQRIMKEHLFFIETSIPPVNEMDIEEANILKRSFENLLAERTTCDDLNFWNEIMEEHLEFIDGLLDPSEEILKETAEDLAENIEKILQENCNKNNEKEILNKSLKSTENVMNFKKAGTEGLLACKIKSIIIPLLGDHVLREANHFLRIMNEMKI